LSAARRWGVRRFVFGSSSSVYGNASRIPFVENAPAAEPISPYAATKRSAELLCRNHYHLYGGSMLCLRFFTVYGPRQRPDLAIRKFSELMVAGRPLTLFGAESGGRDYTWVDDIVSGIVAGIDRSNVETNEFQIINLGGNRVTELRTLVKLLGDALGLRPVVRDLPPQPGDVERTFADINKASRLLGYAPATPIEEGIPRFVAWFNSRRSRL
jgi:UDP-glucuronate 4-epimerase